MVIGVVHTLMGDMSNDEVRLVEQRYDRRALSGVDSRYSLLIDDALLTAQEKERALVKWLRYARLDPARCRLLEIGCGAGNNLIELLRLGFDPSHLAGVELLADRTVLARNRLPEATPIIHGDALSVDLPDAPFDVVFQSTVFTSILDRRYQQQLADRMWACIHPGGGVLWYDFMYDNPANLDVRGVSVSRIRELFPSSHMKSWRLTLAPPISRMVTRIHPALYQFCNIPLLRTHILCWIPK